MREMPQCVNASLFLVLQVFFGTNHMYIFMAVICDMANGRLADCRYFFVSVHDWIKTDFMTNKVASSYTKVIFIVCCFLLKAPNNKKLISVPHITDGVFSVCIICSQQTLKNFPIFLSVWYITTSPIVFFVWLMIWQQIRNELQSFL